MNLTCCAARNHRRFSTRKEQNENFIWNDRSGGSERLRREKFKWILEFGFPVVAKGKLCEILDVRIKTLMRKIIPY